MSRRISDAISSTVLIVLSVAGLLECRNFSESAAIVPTFTLWAILVLAVIQLIKARFIPEEKIHINFKRMGIVVVMLVLYAALMKFLGYYVSTLLFIVGLMAAFEVRNKKVLVGVPIVFCVFVFVVFVKGLSISLPSGLLI